MSKSYWIFKKRKKRSYSKSELVVVSTLELESVVVSTLELDEEDELELELEVVDYELPESQHPESSVVVSTYESSEDDG